MQEIAKTSTLDPQIKDAAISFTRKLFRDTEDSDIVRTLKKEAFKTVYKKMNLDPDEFQAQPRPAGVDPWSGAKPEGPRDFLKSKVVLPSLPQVLLEIQKVINDPESSADDLAAVMSKDPKLVASILRLANSAMYSFKVEVDTPSRAISLLGFKQAGSLALGTVTLSLFKRAEHVSVLHVEKFWKHAIAVGVIAQEIARLAGLGDPERFFVAGMLHDIGLYVIFESNPSLGVELLDLAKGKGNSLYSAETELLGFDHATLGGVILKDWNFPRPLVLGAAGHHSPEKAMSSHDAGVIHVACFIARALRYDLGVAFVLGYFSNQAWGNLGITDGQFMQLLPICRNMIEDIFKILHPE